MHSLGITASSVVAIQFVGAVTSDQAAVGWPTVNLPSGLEKDDVVIVAYQNSSSAIADTTWILGSSNVDTAPSYSWYWKVMGATPDTSVTVPSGAEIAVILAFRNVDPIYPFDTAPTATFGNTGLPNPPSITTVQPSSVVVALGFLDVDETTFTAPSGYRLLATKFDSSSGTTQGTIGAAMKEVTTPGVEDPGAFGQVGAATDRWEAVSIALRTYYRGNRTVATGGTKYYDVVNNYIYHKFTANGNFVVSNLGSTTTVEVLTVAGGGGGGRGASTTTGGGGGGGGGVVANTSVSITAATYPIVVGGGGSGATVSTAKGANGTNSTFNATTVVATAGGGGGSSGNLTGANGGSGGGGGYTATNQGAGGTGTAGQGFDGGRGDTADGAGGGGGAGGIGENGAVDGADNGGDAGTGTQTYSAWLTAVVQSVDGGRVGGGGGGAGDVTAGSATNNGGGGGGSIGTTAGQAGTDFSGGAGGGAQNANGGNGGSGIVIVRYTP